MTRHGHRLVVAALALASSLVVTAAALHARADKAITTPKEQFGFDIGDDYQLANYQQLTAYWKKLDQESDRMKLVDIGKTAEGPPAADGDRHRAREPQEAGALQGDRAPAGAGRGPHRRRGAGARGGRQGGRLDRRRPARHRSARRPAADGDALPDGQPHRRGDAALPARRHHPVRPRQPGRPRPGRRLVHARAGRREAHATQRCRGSTRSTSATTTTATSTCRRSPRRRT